MFDLIIAYMLDLLNVVLSVLSLAKFSGLSTFVYGALAVIMALYIVLSIKPKMKKSILGVSVIAIVLVVLYRVTGSYYTETSVWYTAGFPHLIIYFSLPMIVGGLRGDGERLDQIEKWAPVFAILFSVGAAFATFASSGTTHYGGWVEDDSGMNYQTCAYTAAYSYGLLLAFMPKGFSKNSFPIFRDKMGRGIIWSLIVVDWLIILVSGGKGGFVMALAFSFLFLLKIKQQIHITRRTILVGLSSFVILIGLGFVIVSTVAKGNFAASGFDRIIDFLQTGNDSGRFNHVFNAAIDSIMRNPWTGHGIGSVAFECPPYSHNFFLDVFVETGIVGLIAWILLFVKLALKAKKLYKIDERYYIVMIIILCAGIKSMFSGYCFSHAGIAWGIGFLASCKIEKQNRQCTYRGYYSENGGAL